MRARDYKKGQRYRVIREGARLRGMQPVGPHTQQGWRRELEVGDVITCLGTSMTFGDGVPAVKWGDEDGAWLANDCIFSPASGGLWGGQPPADGYLEEVV
jgi:hypothetical protein